jgi:6,7-dimethyl-8-ribityllumazine synthase
VSKARTALALKKNAGRGLKIGFVVAAFNRNYTSRLLSSASRRLKSLGATFKVVWVPGAFELGLTAKELASTQNYDAVICLGAVLRGETSHYDLVCNAAAQGILRAGMDSGVPVIFGLLSCDTHEQAMRRCSGGELDAGLHAAEAALQMASLIRSIRNGR